MFEATGRRLSEVDPEIFAKAVKDVLKDKGLSVADDKISVEINEGVATVTIRFPTAAQTNTAVTLIGNDNDNDNVFWSELQGSMDGFTIAQVGEVQQIEVRFDPPALPGSAPPSPPLTPEIAGVTTSSGLEVSEIAGIVVGSVVVTLLLLLVCYLVRNKRRVNKANANMLKEMERSSQAVTLERGEQSELGARTTVTDPAPASLLSTRTSSGEGLAEGSASGHFSQR